MHIQINKGHVSMRGQGILLKNIAIKPLPIEGGELIANCIVGITSNVVGAPPSNAMASVGGGIDFSKHVKRAAQSVQKRKDKEQNIKFVF